MLRLPHPIRFVLVEPQGPINIGSVCRSMKNFGLRDLVLVKPRCRIGPMAERMAIHAKDLLTAARRVRSTAAAVEDCVLVLGTSNRSGPYHEPNLLPADGVRRLAERVATGPVAVLFGREDFGLSQADLAHCQGTIRIPTDADFTSLNLAQAVNLIGYEIFRHFAAASFVPPPPPENPVFLPATNAELHRLYDHMAACLLHCEFLMENNPDRIMQVLRGVFGRAALNRREVKLLMGMFSNIRGFMDRHPRRPRPESRARLR